VQDVAERHEAGLARLEEHRRLDRLCELNVIEQVLNVSHTTIVQDAWARGKRLSVHGWIYAMADGLLRDLSLCVTSAQEAHGAYHRAVGG
jgi:carbonic anhydrase